MLNWEQTCVTERINCNALSSKLFEHSVADSPDITKTTRTGNSRAHFTVPDARCSFSKGSLVVALHGAGTTCTDLRASARLLRPGMVLASLARAVIVITLWGIQTCIWLLFWLFMLIVGLILLGAGRHFILEEERAKVAETQVRNASRAGAAPRPQGPEWTHAPRPHATVHIAFIGARQCWVSHAAWCRVLAPMADTDLPLLHSRKTPSLRPGAASRQLETDRQRVEALFMSPQNEDLFASSRGVSDSADGNFENDPLRLGYDGSLGTVLRRAAAMDWRPTVMAAIYMSPLFLMWWLGGPVSTARGAWALLSALSMRVLLPLSGKQTPAPEPGAALLPASPAPDIPATASPPPALSPEERVEAVLYAGWVAVNGATQRYLLPSLHTAWLSLCSIAHATLQAAPSDVQTAWQATSGARWEVWALAFALALLAGGQACRHWRRRPAASCCRKAPAAQQQQQQQQRHTLPASPSSLQEHGLDSALFGGGAPPRPSARREAHSHHRRSLELSDQQAWASQHWSGQGLATAPLPYSPRTTPPASSHDSGRGGSAQGEAQGEQRLGASLQPALAASRLKAIHASRQASSRSPSRHLPAPEPPTLASHHSTPARLDRPPTAQSFPSQDSAVSDQEGRVHRLRHAYTSSAVLGSSGVADPGSVVSGAADSPHPSPPPPVKPSPVPAHTASDSGAPAAVPPAPPRPTHGRSATMAAMSALDTAFGELTPPPAKDEGGSGSEGGDTSTVSEKQGPARSEAASGHLRSTRSFRGSVTAVMAAQRMSRWGRGGGDLWEAPFSSGLPGRTTSNTSRERQRDTPAPAPAGRGGEGATPHSDAESASGMPTPRPLPPPPTRQRPPPAPPRGSDPEPAQHWSHEGGTVASTGASSSRSAQGRRAARRAREREAMNRRLAALAGEA